MRSHYMGRSGVLRLVPATAIPVNLHRPLADYEDLDVTFTWQEERTLSASLTLQYDTVLYLVDPCPRETAACGQARKCARPLGFGQMHRNARIVPVHFLARCKPTAVSDERPLWCFEIRALRPRLLHEFDPIADGSSA